MTPPSISPGKAALAGILGKTPWTRLVTRLEARIPVLRVFNHHGTPPRLRDELARQFDYLLERFGGVSGDALEGLLQRGPRDRSTALFTFDDGLANHLEVAAPLLEERGLRGIFCVPTEFPSVAAAHQPRWFLERVRPARNAEHLEDRDLLALSWDGVRELSQRGHAIYCHTSSHVRIGPELPPESLRREIVDSRAELADRLGQGAVDGFCWPMGFDGRAQEAEALVRAHYRWAFVDGARPVRAGQNPHRIQRTNLEASWPQEIVELELSGVTDIKSAVRGVWRRAGEVWR